MPHIGCLNKVEDHTGAESTCVYSYSQAWKRYISQNIVSRHAHRIIVQFMAACCGKSKTTESQSEAPASGSTRDCPPNDLLLSQVHSLIDELGQSTPKLVKPKAMGQVKDADGDDKDSDGEQKQ